MHSPDNNIVDYYWQHVESAVYEIAEHMKTFSVPGWNIIGISRGGMIPAIMLAHHFKVERVQTIYCSTYKDGHLPQEIPKLSTSWALDHRTQYDLPWTVVIDDILDTGATMKAVHELLPRAKLYTLVRKRKPDQLPIVKFVDEVPYNAWVNFPWE